MGANGCVPISLDQPFWWWAALGLLIALAF
jgi:hypothetical protein